MFILVGEFWGFYFFQSYRYCNTVHDIGSVIFSQNSVFQPRFEWNGFNDVSHRQHDGQICIIDRFFEACVSKCEHGLAQKKNETELYNCKQGSGTGLQGSSRSAHNSNTNNHPITSANVANVCQKRAPSWTFRTCNSNDCFPPKPWGVRISPQNT